MIIIEKYPRKGIRDDFCTRTASDDNVWIYEKGTPPAMRLICSVEHLKEIIEQGQKYLGIASEPNDDLIKQLEAKDAKIEHLERELEACEAEVKRLTVLLESDKQNKVQADGAGENDDLEKMSKQELYAIAKELGVAGRYTTMNKAELIKKIREAQKK
jgi:hypothetical protein